MTHLITEIPAKIKTGAKADEIVALCRAAVDYKGDPLPLANAVNYLERQDDQWKRLDYGRDDHFEMDAALKILKAEIPVEAPSSTVADDHVVLQQHQIRTQQLSRRRTTGDAWLDECDEALRSCRR